MRCPPLLRAKLDETVGIAAADYDEARRTANRGPQGAGQNLRRFRRVADLLRAGCCAEGAGLDRRYPFQQAVDADGRSPASMFPAHVADGGLPVGVQVIARFGNDAGALKVATFSSRMHWRRVER